MAWTSQGEEIKAALRKYTAHLTPEKKAKLNNIYSKAINPFRGEWTTMNQVIFVNLRNRENVLSNLQLAMLKEIVGLGPQYYCVIRTHNLDFESFFMLILCYLPKDKFCIYPEDESLRGPFLYKPWKILGQRICNRPTISLEYLAYLEHKAESVPHP